MYTALIKRTFTDAIIVFGAWRGEGWDPFSKLYFPQGFTDNDSREKYPNPAMFLSQQFYRNRQRGRVADTYISSFNLKFIKFITEMYKPEKLLLPICVSTLCAEIWLPRGWIYILKTTKVSPPYFSRFFVLFHYLFCSWYLKWEQW